MTEKKATTLSAVLRIFSYIIIALGYGLVGINQSMLIIIPTDIASDAPVKYPRNDAVSIERDRYDLAINIGRDISKKMPNVIFPVILIGGGYYLHMISSRSRRGLKAELPSGRSSKFTS